jgi:hypothetical protein
MPEANLLTSASDVNRDPTDVNNPKFDSKGKNTKKAIQDADQALQIARRLERDDDKRDFNRARVVAAFNGNPPYDERDILSAGQSYRFNVSFGYMEGVIGRAVVPFYELMSDTQYICNVEGDLEEEKLRIIRDEFAETLRRWGKWPKLASRLCEDLLLHGWNNLIWPTYYNPWPNFVPQTEGFVHELQQNDVSDLEVFVWKKAYLVHELYNFIADEEVARKAGWNVPNVRKAIENATQSDVFQRHRGGGWTAVESAIRGGTLFSSVVGGKQINTFHVFATEENGQVTHYIVYGGKVGPSDISGPNAELFVKEKQFPEMEEFLVYFDIDPGDGKWHGSRGLGKRAFNTHRALDKLRCQLMDQAVTSGMTILQADDQSNQEDFTLSVMGPFCVIPPGINVQATSLPAIATTAFQVDALVSNAMEQRTGDIMPQAPSFVRGTRKTASEANIAASRQAMISKGNIMRFLDPLSKSISIILRRLMRENSPDPYAQEFQKNLARHGITADDMKKVRHAKSTGRVDAVLGNEETKYQKMLQMFRGDPNFNQKELDRRAGAAIVGPKEMEGLIIEDEDKTIQVEAARQQTIETMMMMQGVPMPVSPRDNHEVHASVLADMLESMVKNQAQSGNVPPPQQVTVLLQHLEQHIKVMESDESKKQLVAALKMKMKEIAQAVMQGHAAKSQANSAKAKAAGASVPAAGPVAPQGTEVVEPTA